MATATQTTKNRNGSPNMGSDADEIEVKLQKIKGDIADLARTLGDIGGKHVKEVKSEADQRVADIVRASEQSLDELRRQLRTVEGNLEARVREKPLQTLGIAAGIGFLMAVILRR